MKIRQILYIGLAAALFGSTAFGQAAPPAYETPQEFWDLYYDFTGASDPTFPKGKRNAAMILNDAAQNSASALPSQDGPLVMFIDSTLYVYDNNGKQLLNLLMRTAPDSGFTEMTAVSHVGPAIAYLAKAKEYGAKDWTDGMQLFLKDLQAVRDVNAKKTNNWLDSVNAPPWANHKTQIKNMIDYACSMAGNYIADVLTGKKAFTVANVQTDFYEESPDFPIPFNDVMVATFMLTAYESMAAVQSKLAAIPVDWTKAKVLIRFVAGSNVTSGVSKESNWLVPFVIALSNNQLPSDRIYIAPYMEVKPSLEAKQLSPEDLAYYNTRFISTYNRTHIAKEVFSEIADITLATNDQMPGNYGASKATDVGDFIIRLKYSLSQPTEMLSNTVGFWMAGEMAAKKWQLDKVDIPGLTAGLPDGITGYPATSPAIPQNVKVTPLANVLVPHQKLATSAARKVTPFKIKGKNFVAVAQLANNVSSKTSDTSADLLIYQWQRGEFKLYQRIASQGSEDAVFFNIGKRPFLAVASVNNGVKTLPNTKSGSTVYEWDGEFFRPFQQFKSTTANKWEHFTIGKKHFLALANGEARGGDRVLPTTKSTVYTWNGERFEDFQNFRTKSSYGFYFFEVGKNQFLGLTDHGQASKIYRWNGSRFDEFQTLDANGGRALTHFKMKGKDYLAYANMANPSQILKWDGKRFVKEQELPGAGARNFTFFTSGKKSYLFKVADAASLPNGQNTRMTSSLYSWRDGKFRPEQNISNYGGVGASAFQIDGKTYLGVANMHNSKSRYLGDSVIYRVNR